MDHIDDIIKDSKKILKSLYDNEESSPEVIQNVGSIDGFRSRLLQFISAQLEPIKRTQSLLDLVDAEIISKLILHEYDKNELMDLRRELIQSTNTKTSVLLEPFKPNNAGNSLITPPSATSSSNDDPLKKLNPDQRIALDKLYRIITSKENNEEDK